MATETHHEPQFHSTLDSHHSESGPFLQISTSVLSENDIEILQEELPVVYDGQVPLSELLSRVMQSIYAELSELAETMPGMSDAARKRTLADWVVKTKKQVVKLYAAVKWARDADTVQKSMNITAFLMTQNQQFEDAVKALHYGKESLNPAKLRNHDLLTSLDVLTSGSYLRLPTCIKNVVIPPPLLTDDEVKRTLSNMEDVIRYRLRMTEIIPVEMSRHHIGDGRVYFVVPKLFETSLCLRGAEKDDGWFFVHVEFLFNVGGDSTGLQEFPRAPKGITKRHIMDEADARLAYYLPPPSTQTEEQTSSRPQLPEGRVDTPLVRVYNFLQMMTLSYQLEILWYQAERMRFLGWKDYLAVNMSPNRKTLTALYWRPSIAVIPGRPWMKIPPQGGTLIVSIVEAKTTTTRKPKQRVLAQLQERSKLGDAKPSDEVESLKIVVQWTPSKEVFGVTCLPADIVLSEDALNVDADRLDFQSMLQTVIRQHTGAILSAFKSRLQKDKTGEFSSPGVVSLITDDTIQALRIHLCADEIVTVTVDSRTGRLNLRSIGDLATAGRGPRFLKISERLNEDPNLLSALTNLRVLTIIDSAEQKAKYLGLQSYRRRNFQPNEIYKLRGARGTLFIQLANFPNYYLVLVIRDRGFNYALISTKILPESSSATMVMEDIAFLDFDSMPGEDIVITAHSAEFDPHISMQRSRVSVDGNARGDNQVGQTSGSFDFEIQALRQLYSYCCARVAYLNVERQFKLRGIPFTHVDPTGGPTSAELGYIQSSLARSVPALCVQSKDILSGAPAAEAAMPNIRVIPLNWWSEDTAQVVTCVKLKYVQQPMGKTAGRSVIRPSKRIVYDTKEAVVSFLSENVNTCVDEFLEEWARVSKMVVIAREVAQMTKVKGWHDIRLLSFDLQTVEFAYAQDYAVSISCEDQLSLTGGSFHLRFSQCPQDSVRDEEGSYNPHDEAETFMNNILQHGHGRLAPSLHCLVALLRDTLPIVVELESIRRSSKQGSCIDVFAKAAGWYRLLYTDLKHALDLRLMSGQRVAILDASHSLFETKRQGGTAPETVENEVMLRPIPHFKEIVLDAVKQVMLAENVQSHNIAAIDVGVVCDTDLVGALGRIIHTKVVEQLTP